jgi:hypothetical protein
MERAITTTCEFPRDFCSATSSLEVGKAKGDREGRPYFSGQLGLLLVEKRGFPSLLCGALTAILIILLIYRGTLTMKEDDQLFLDESSSGMAEEQRQVMVKVKKVNPLVKVLGATSGVMFLIIAGWAVYLGLNAVQP